jgi:phage-related protein
MRENRDRYLGFTFNGKSLGMKTENDFYGFIQNNGEDLSFSNTPQFGDEFVVPQYGDRTFYTGTTKSNRAFSMKISLDKITLRQYRDLLAWLNPNSTGNLSFDFDPNYGYEVKLSSISQGQFYILKETNNNEDFYYVDFDITFITISD